jgi:hypothetical protein
MSFATSKIEANNRAIAKLQSTIAALQNELTQLQEKQQEIKSAEQQGLSAITQYKQALTAIVQSKEPEVLDQFLAEMGAVTASLVGSEFLEESKEKNEQPSASEEQEQPPDTEPEQATQETTAITPRKKLSDVIVEAVKGNDSPAWCDTDDKNVLRHKRNKLLRFCRDHGIQVKPGAIKREMVELIKARYSPDYVASWLIVNHL